MCDAVFTLSAAAFLLDEPRYGQRAARVIQTWFINPKTRMNPHLQYGQVIRGVSEAGAGILDGRSFIRAIQGMEFLAQTRTWDPGTRPPSAVVRRISPLAHHQPGSRGRKAQRQ